MSTDYLSCYKLNNKSLPRREKFSRTQILSNFQCNSSCGVFKHWCSLISKRKNFQTCILEKVSAYHTGSAFTQHHYICHVLFIPNRYSLFFFFAKMKLCLFGPQFKHLVMTKIQTCSATCQDKCTEYREITEQQFTCKILKGITLVAQGQSFKYKHL